MSVRYTQNQGDKQFLCTKMVPHKQQLPRFLLLVLRTLALVEHIGVQAGYSQQLEHKLVPLLESLLLSQSPYTQNLCCTQLPHTVCFEEAELAQYFVLQYWNKCILLWEDHFQFGSSHTPRLPCTSNLNSHQLEGKVLVVDG